MSGSNAKTEWYLARDGQQHGPLTDAELKKFIELGHLNPTDLVWRAGFPEWRTASEVFPETQTKPEPPPTPPAPPPSAPAPPTAPAKTEQTTGVTQPPDEQQRKTERDQGHTDPNRASPNDTTEISRNPAPSKATSQPAPNSASELAMHDRSSTSAPLSASGDVAPSARPSDTSVVGATPAPHMDRPNSRQQTARAAMPGGPPSDGGSQPRPGAGHQHSARPGPGGHTAYQHPGNGPPVGQPGGGPNRQMAPGAQPSSQPGPQPGNGGGAGAPNFSAQQGRPGSHPNQQQAYAPQQAESPAKQQGDFDDDDFYDDFDSEPKRRPLLAAVLALMVLGVIGAGGWFAYTNQATLIKVINDLTAEGTGDPAVVAAPKEPARSAAETAAEKVASAAPASVQPASIQTINATDPASPGVGFFKGKAWQAFARQYPNWVKDQETAVEKMRTEGRSKDEILAFVINAIVKWRRKNADNIMKASPDHLRSLAKSFVANLKFLVEQDVQACYGFISKGELSPAVMPYYGNDAQADVLGSQTEAIIAAAKNSNLATTTYEAPSPPDFNKLAQLLIQRGWSEDDLKMFSDPTALSSAPADKVCKLVTEWFDTQLQMAPSEQQMRLLATSLQPVVRG